MRNFIWRGELRLIVHSLKVLASFFKISLSHLFFHVGCFFHESVLVIHSLRGYMEQIIFDGSYLLRKMTFLEDFPQTFNLLRQVYLFHNFNCSHPSFDVGYLFLSEWHLFFLWRGLYLLWWKNLQSSYLSNSFSSNVYFLKKVGSSYAYRNYFYKNTRRHAFFQP